MSNCLAMFGIFDLGAFYNIQVLLKAEPLRSQEIEMALHSWPYLLVDMIGDYGNMGQPVQLEGMETTMFET